MFCSGASNVTLSYMSCRLDMWFILFQAFPKWCAVLCQSRHSHIQQTPPRKSESGNCYFCFYFFCFVGFHRLSSKRMATLGRWIFISERETGFNASFCLVLVKSGTEWSPCPSQASVAGSLGAVFWILKCSRAEKQNTTKQELGLESTWRTLLKHKYIKTRACPAWQQGLGLAGPLQR